MNVVNIYTNFEVICIKFYCMSNVEVLVNLKPFLTFVVLECKEYTIETLFMVLY